jgi:hypothetical protein
MVSNPGEMLTFYSGANMLEPERGMAALYRKRTVNFASYR